MTLFTVLFVATACAAAPASVVVLRPDLPVVSEIPAPSKTTPLVLEPAGTRTFTFPGGSVTVPWYTVAMDLRESQGGPNQDPARWRRTWSRIQCPIPAVEAHLAEYDLIDMSYSPESFQPDGSHASFAELQVSFASPEDFGIRPQAPARLYSLRERELPTNGASVFSRGEFYIFCLNRHPETPVAGDRPALSASWPELGAVIAPVYTRALHAVLANPLYVPTRDALTRLVLSPDDPDDVEVRRTEGDTLVVRRGSGPELPCDAGLGDDIAYAFAQLPWMLRNTPPPAPGLPTDLRLELVGRDGRPRAVRVILDDLWYAQTPEEQWYAVQKPTDAMDAVREDIGKCNPDPQQAAS